jgi:hypothetical protein
MDMVLTLMTGYRHRSIFSPSLDQGPKPDWRIAKESQELSSASASPFPVGHSLPLFSNSAPTSLITFPTSSIPSIILLPTPARIPYGLRLVISSEEYAKESIELEEGVSDGICKGRNEYLGGKAGGDPSRGDSGGEASK